MIRKPDADWAVGESKAVRTIRNAGAVAKGGVDVARAGGHALRGVVCFGFAGLWGFAALAGGLAAGSLPTLIGVGAMSAGMAWAGKRSFAKARAVSGR